MSTVAVDTHPAAINHQAKSEYQLGKETEASRMHQDCRHDPLPQQNTTEEGTAQPITLTDSKTERDHLGHHAAPLAVLGRLKSILISPAMTVMRPVGTNGVGATQTGMTDDTTGGGPLIMMIGPEQAGPEVGVDHQFVIGRETEREMFIGGRTPERILGRSPSLPSGGQQVGGEHGRPQLHTQIYNGADGKYRRQL